MPTRFPMARTRSPSNCAKRVISQRASSPARMLAALPVCSAASMNSSTIRLLTGNTRADQATDSAALNRLLLPWLEKHHDAPFFLYAHSTDPHAPYDPPAPYNALFANPAQNAAFQRNYMGLHTNNSYGGGAVVNPELVRRDGIDPNTFIREAIDRYDGEIAHNDHQLQLLFAELKRLGVLANTIVIILSDHGEEFFDHGWTAHGHTVYQELTHV